MKFHHPRINTQIEQPEMKQNLKNSFLEDVINTKLSKKIRNIGILNKNSKLNVILNDRKILELMVRSKDKFITPDNNTLDKFNFRKS